ncbi:hypothetical protein DAI22_06g056300 [Oryza sativa Japonica Group]|nr:hypothetical protein DAI22_06g056300 [Oryza sativa Japonica Group]
MLDIISVDRCQICVTSSTESTDMKKSSTGCKKFYLN